MQTIPDPLSVDHPIARRVQHILVNGSRPKNAAGKFLGCTGCSVSGRYAYFLDPDSLDKAPTMLTGEITIVMRTQYVVGLAFSRDRQSVVLIHKKTGPECVIGKWNGVGGKIEPGESPLEAMAREFREETGANSTLEDWSQFATLIADDYDLHFFVSDTIGLSQVRTMEDETVKVCDCLNAIASPNLMPNMRWMIPYLMDTEIKHQLGTLRVRR